MPPFALGLPAPEIQTSTPSTVVAARTLSPLSPVLNTVAVLMAPVTSIRPATRFTVVLLIPVMPGAAAYPASASRCPSADSERQPSEPAEPDIVSA